MSYYAYVLVKDGVPLEVHVDKETAAERFGEGVGASLWRSPTDGLEECPKLIGWRIPVTVQTTGQPVAGRRIDFRLRVGGVWTWEGHTLIDKDGCAHFAITTQGVEWLAPCWTEWSVQVGGYSASGRHWGQPGASLTVTLPTEG